MNISKKLFLSFLGLTMLVLVATLSLARWGFAQGFSDFINAMEKQRLENVAVDLVDIYLQYDEVWENVPSFELVSVLRRHELGKKKPPPHKGRGPGRMGGPPPPRYPAEPIENRELERNDRSLQSIINTTLLNMKRESIIDGPTSITTWAKDTTVTEVLIEFNSQPIGILQSYHSNLMDSNIASEFSRQQLLWSTGVGGLCLLLALLLAYLLSKLLLDPIQTVLESVARLRSGEYELSLSHQRHDELGQLMTDIESLSQTLNSAKLAKSKWIADISHELRTPLTVLIGEIDLIKAGVRPFDQTNLASLEEEVNRLYRLVEDLYQLSVSDTGALRYQMTDFKFFPVLAAVVAKKQFEFASKDISLSIRNQLPESNDGEVNIYADEQRIEQLLLNLLNNSLQYTDPKGQLIIQLSKYKDNLVIIFSDSAPTVAEEDCEHLFAPLQRQDAARTRYNSGAGLGLAICRNIAHAHHGEIHAKPSELGGISIAVTLPIKGIKI